MCDSHRPLEGADSVRITDGCYDGGSDVAYQRYHAMGCTAPTDAECRRRPIEGADSVRITAWDAYIDRRLADVEADLNDEESMQSLGLHGRVRLHERRAVLQDIRQQLDYADAELQRAKDAR